MSKVGKKPIEVSKDVKVNIVGKTVNVEGKKGKLSYTLPEGIAAKLDNGVLTIVTEREADELKKFHGLARALVNNMVEGVVKGYSKALELSGVGYKAQMKGKTLVLSVGYSHTVDMPVWEGLTVTTATPTEVKVEGADKQRVGEFAAQIRRVRPPEPYNGKGIKFVGETIRRKAGKAMGKK